MRPRGKTPISSGGIGPYIGGRIAILIVLGAAAIFGSRALAQSPEPSASATSTISAPQSTSNSAASSGAIIGAPSPLATISSRSRTPSPAATSSAGARNPAAVSPTDPQTVIAYLSDVISWYRHLGVEAQLVVEPNEMLYFAADRQVANDILNLAFDYARTQAKFIANSTGQTTIGAKPAGAASSAAVPAVGPPKPSGPVSDLGQRFEQLQATAAALQAQLKDLQTKIKNSPARQRAAISAEIATTRSELDLVDARLAALNAILQFQTGSVSPEQDLSGEIDQLEHSISEAERNVKPALTARPVVEPSGILSLTSDLIELERRMDALERTEELTKALSVRVSQIRDQIVKRISALDARAYQLAGANAADVAALRERKQAFETLLAEHKIASASALPLSKQIVLLDIYANNLERWRAAINDRWANEFRSLCIRLIGLAGSLGLIFLGGLIWRWLTDRYVQDIRRRGQVLAARRLALGLLILFVLLINFSDEIGSAATVVGFAAAGIAVALQNVILSVAGYFFLIGKFGIKAGDRVQLGGVTGDVIDIGLVKLSMMELGGDGTHRQPTGRVVVFSNSIVFQPAGNYFKQAPGTSFVWNEVRLTLAPDADYRLAEKRLLDAVDEVFTRYRDRVVAEFRRLERDLNIILETPKPQSRLYLSHSGLEIIIRYPAEARTAAQIADEVSRRVLDAIGREPSLRLATEGIANIQPQEPPPVTVADGQPSADQPSDGQAENGQADETTAAEKKASGPAPADK